MSGNLVPVGSIGEQDRKSALAFSNSPTSKISHSDLADSSADHSHIHKPGRNDLRLVFWETTSACNLECIHCRRMDVALELAKNDMETEKGKRFIDSLSDFAKPILVF